MEKVKVYLDEARNATIVCENCGKSKEISFSTKEVPRSSLAKCGCGNHFIISFEKRLHYRKPVDVQGICFDFADSDKSEPIRILDVSAHGLQFEVPGPNGFKLEQKLKVLFCLGDRTVNMIVSVRHISGGNIGAKITGIDAHSKRVIGFYLLP